MVCLVAVSRSFGRTAQSAFTVEALMYLEDVRLW